MPKARQRVRLDSDESWSVPRMTGLGKPAESGMRQEQKAKISMRFRLLP